MPFKFKETPIKDLIIIEPRVFPDDRGFFMETYKSSDFAKAGINESFLQDNHSFSSKGVLRGLHFQSAPHSQGKLVRVVKGAAWDVGVDLRPNSATYKQWYGLELNEKNNKMFYIPQGFAHGFLTLTDNTHFLYKCTTEYAPASDGGIRWNDPDIAVDWPLEPGVSSDVSEKDAVLPYLKDVK